MQAVLLLLNLRREAAKREELLQSEIDKVKRRMAKRRFSAISQLILLIAEDEHRNPRRVVQRCLGKWRGSSIGGYVRDGDDQTYHENFRMERKTFDKLLSLIEKTSFAAVTTPPILPGMRKRAKRRSGEHVSFARAHTDPPSTRFKMAVCLYAMAQGGRFKQVGDAAGISNNTVRKYMVAFCEAVMTAVKPIYMPATPHSASEREYIRGKFASRCGIPNVALACDGTHIPYHPRGGKKAKMAYRNYKGWTSILAVAWVDSYHRFFDLHAGFSGRAGDNTVLARSRLMDAIREDPETWLGPGGVILGDCGASDGNGVFLNPYHSPTESEQCWFNFCHSSTRFFVEETFGRWKNRWRFLLDPCRVDHKLTSQMTNASAVLHNFCTAHPRDQTDDLPPEMSDKAWQTFYREYDAHVCPTCRRRGVAYCIHQGVYRNGAASVTAARQAPSEVRNQLRDNLWMWVSAGVTTAATENELVESLGCLERESPDANRVVAADTIRTIMGNRAANRDGAYEVHL